MKKSVLILAALFALISGQSQTLKPNSVSIAYFGETITHPGLRISVGYEKQLQTKIKTGKAEERSVLRSIVLRPSMGLFYHKHYQTGFFVLPETGYRRVNDKGTFTGFGVGIGYLRTAVPNTYTLSASGDISRVKTGNNHLVSSLYFVAGKDLSVRKNSPISWYIKPQIMQSVFSSNAGAGYFMLELGLSYKL